MTETLPDEVRHAGNALDSIQALSRRARGRVLPAYAVAEILEHLRDLALELPNALDQVGKALVRTTENINRADIDGDVTPEQSLMAREEMRFAGELAKALTSQIEASVASLRGGARNERNGESRLGG